MHALIALDDSEASWDAAVFAGSLLHPDDQVTVINVVSSKTPVRLAARALTGYLVGTSRPTDEGGDSDVLHALRPAIAAANADAVVVEQGHVVERICSVAEDSSVNLIIVGTRDRNAIMRFLTGSVSQSLVDDAPCSVLVVR